MSLPWSSKGSKGTPINADELLILDSADPTPSTKNKRITIGSLPATEVFTWTANHDADGFDLQDLSNLEFRDTTGAPGISVPAIWNDPNGMKFNEPTGDNFTWTINGVSEFIFDAAQANLLGNELVNTGQVGLGQAAVTAGKQVAITIPDDTLNEGIIVQNTDGSWAIQNSGASVGQFEGLMEWHMINGDEFGENIWRTFIPIAEDTGTAPIIIFEVAREGSTPITVRPIIAYRSFGGTELWQLNINGDVDMFGNDLIEMGILSFADLNTSIDQVGTDLEYDVATAGVHDFRINNTVEYSYSATQADFLGNNARNLGFIESNAAIPADAGVVRLGNNEFITWRDSGNTRNARIGLTTGDTVQVDQADFQINARNDDTVNIELISNEQTPSAGDNLTNILFTGNNDFPDPVSFAEIDVTARVVTDGSEVGEIRFIAVNQDTGPGDPLLSINELGVTGVHILNGPLYFTSSSTFPDSAVIIFNNGGGMNLNVVDTGFDFVIGSTFEYFFGPSSADWSANNLTNVGLLNQRFTNNTAIHELEANHATPANAQVIGQIDFIDDSSTGVRRTYSQIRGLIEDPTNTTEDGELFLSVIKGGTLTDYLAINQANDGNITLLQNIEIADATDIVLNATTGTKIGTATSEKLGFWNATPVVQPTALTITETTLTFVNENTPDFALSSLTTTSAAGFATLDEAQAFVEVVVNIQARVNELETKLQAVGMLA